MPGVTRIGKHVFAADPLDLLERETSPDTPSVGVVRIFAKTDMISYVLDSEGGEVPLALHQWTPPFSAEATVGEFNATREAGGLALIADTLFAKPLVIPEHTIEFTAMCVFVQSPAPGKSIRMGIYHHGISTTFPTDPDALLVDAGTADISTTGMKEISVSVTLSPGFYWLAIVSDSSVAKLHTDALESAKSITLLASNGLAVYQLSKAHTFGPLPDPFGTADRTIVSVTPYRTMLRVA